LKDREIYHRNPARENRKRIWSPYPPRYKRGAL
jgi:hypothetical protein